MHSHHNKNNNFTKYDKKIISADFCSAVVFDGRILHRGLANDSDETRYAIYITYFDSFYTRREHGKGLNIYS